MNNNSFTKILICGLAFGIVAHFGDSLAVGQIDRLLGFSLSDKNSSRNRRGRSTPQPIYPVAPASFQSDANPIGANQSNIAQPSATSQQQTSSIPNHVGQQITNHARDMAANASSRMPIQNQQHNGANAGNSPPTIQFRDDYDQQYQAFRAADGRRFSTDVGANLSGTYSTPSPRMAASEMVVNQAAKIEMLERIIRNYQAENTTLKRELILTINSLTQTNLAFQELQTQMTSVDQQNRVLKIKFKELAETYSRSETEIQQMLNQLRLYVSKELNSADISSGIQPLNQLVEPGVLPNSELLPSPK